MKRSDDETEGAGRVRVDKWLWAARFFKTRSLAAEAIGGGKVQVNGDRPKAAKLLQAGDEVSIRLGPPRRRGPRGGGRPLQGGAGAPPRGPPPPVGAASPGPRRIRLRGQGPPHE